jgi:hypothetical protein
VVPHVNDKAPTACRSGGTMAHVGFPYPGSLTGAPRLAFEPVVERYSDCTVHGPGPLKLISYFSKLNQICKL